MLSALSAGPQLILDGRGSSPDSFPLQDREARALREELGFNSLCHHSERRTLRERAGEVWRTRSRKSRVYEQRCDVIR